MSKGLEALEKIGYAIEETDWGQFYIWENYYDEYQLIKKELKALEIIKHKNLHMDKLQTCLKRNWNFETYNKMVTGYQRVNEVEYELLKEVLL